MNDCEEKRLCLTYPQHRLKPVDVLHFIESTSFTTDWDAGGFDLEDDLSSLQVCLMAHPEGHGEVDGTQGLRFHCHTFGDWSEFKDASIGVYYSYFEEFGIIYLSCFTDDGLKVEFSPKQLGEIRRSIAETRHEIERLQSFR